MMTKKDYKRAAEIVLDSAKSFGKRDAIANVALVAMIDGFTLLFRGDNPRFDVEKFHEACGGR